MRYEAPSKLQKHCNLQYTFHALLLLPKETKVWYLTYTRSFNLACYEKTQLGLTTQKCASSHRSVEAGLHNGEYFLFKSLEVPFLHLLEALLLTRAEVEHSKALITYTASLGNASATNNSDIEPIKVFIRWLWSLDKKWL